MKKRLSISDIAKNLGISVTTVSFILNGKAKERRISDALTRRVQDYVQKVGYKPNQLAKSLRTGKSKTLGLLVEDISNSFFAGIANELERMAYDKGYHILYCSMNNDVNRAKELIELFYDRQIDGFIIAPTEGLTDVIQKLLKNNVPVVLFDRFIEGLDTHYVISENKTGALVGTEYLLKHIGADRIGFVTTTSNQPQMKGRLEGYMEAVDKLNKDMLIKKVVTNEGEEHMLEQIKMFIENNRLDALFFSTNYLALAGLKAVKQFKLDLNRFVSFDDNIAFSLIEPPISSISQNITEISSQIIKILVNEINGKNKKIEQIVVPCDFIQR